MDYKDKQQMKAELLKIINSVPLGEQTLPAAYIATLDKPDNVSWATFTRLYQQKFFEKQQAIIRQREIEKEERDALMNPALLQSDTQRLIDFQKQKREEQKKMKDRTAHQTEEHRRTMQELQEEHKDLIQYSEQVPKDSTQCHDDKNKRR